MKNPRDVRIWRILTFPQAIIHPSLFAICPPLSETKTMPRLILAVGGASLGSFPIFFTDEEKEHLQLFRRIFDVDITNANTQITMITKSCSTKDWAPTRHHIIDLVRQYIMELMGSNKIILQRTGADNGPPSQSISSIPSALADHYRKKGYEADEPERGLQDFIAYTLVRLHDHSTLLSSHGSVQYIATMQMSTFGVPLPAMFASLSPVAKEIVALHKTLVIGLGDKLTQPIKLLVYTTVADISKWPTSHVKAVDISQQFIKDQVLHRRVSLEPRLEGAYFGKGFAADDDNDDDNDDIQVGTGETVRSAMAGSLPQNFVDMVDCFFPPDLAVNNHIVDIVRVSMGLAGNHSLPEVSVASPNQDVANYGSKGTPEGDEASEATFHTPNSSQAVMVNDDPRMFPMHTLIEVAPANG